MKVLHIVLSGYKEGYGYQENILSIKHRQLGFDVSIVAFDRFNFFNSLNADEHGIKSYVNEYGIKITILPPNDSWLKKLHLWAFSTYLYKTKYLYESLNLEQPDIIFVHGVHMADYDLIVKYKKHNPSVKLYVDNHADYFNSPVVTLKEKISRKIIGRRIVQRLAAVSEKVWGVTPWRVDYLRDVYGLKEPKIGLLVMGGDEQYIHWDRRNEIRAAFRESHHIPADAFVIVTGGKIDKNKNIHLLIDAVQSIDNPLLYLVVFGNYSDELKQYALVNCPRIINLGWVASNDVYDIFLASDLAAFPGTHSVLWEQACASGIPCLFKDWEGGFNHVDLGGNCIMLKDISIDTLKETLAGLVGDKERFDGMCEVAERKCRKEFAYIEIAKKAIEL